MLHSKYLVEHFFQVLLGIHPGCNSITKEYKVWNNSCRVYSYHLTHSTESTIFLFIVTNIAQRRAPKTQSIAKKVFPIPLPRPLINKKEIIILLTSKLFDIQNSNHYITTNTPCDSVRNTTHSTDVLKM